MIFMRDGCCAGARSPAEISGRKNGRQCMKTPRWRCQPGLPRKHPHGCGEDSRSDCGISACGETPPRVWGRPPSSPSSPSSPGNTPTGVGKTAYRQFRSILKKKHPHGCGEDVRDAADRDLDIETPPRVWGRPSSEYIIRSDNRNTPTGVGKTAGGCAPVVRVRKHPHGCGEDGHIPEARAEIPETPPRVWGRRDRCGVLAHMPGNTPTGVGKTPPWRRTWARTGKHPHGCGEDSRSDCGISACGETPPRVWGRPTTRCWTTATTGNTPTGVGKT